MMTVNLNLTKSGHKLFGFFLSLTLICIISSTAIPVKAADRFTPINLNTSLHEFNNRFSTDIFNTDFLVSHILNNARQLEQLRDDLRDDASYFTDQINSASGAISNSVIIPPGTDAETIIIINQTEGDSFAIQR